MKFKLFSVFLITAFFSFALVLRVTLSYDQVFTDVGIKFTSNDSYFFMRQVDNLVSNFPKHTIIDPYVSYPVESGWLRTSFLVWLIAVPAWITGLGSPSQHTIDLIAVYLPPILAALTVIPVYFIGKEVFGRWAGLLAAGLIAILPGEFLGRSILGFTDNHVAEALFSAVAMLFLILAVKSADQRQLTFNHVKSRDWAVIRKPLIYSLLAAFSLGVYIATWLGALLFVFITFLFFVIQFIIDYLRRKPVGYLTFVGVIFFSVTFLITWLMSSDMRYLASLIIAVFAVPALSFISRWMANKGIRFAGVVVFYLVLLFLSAISWSMPASIIERLLSIVIPLTLGILYMVVPSQRTKFAYPMTLIGLAGVGGGLLYLVNRSLFSSMVSAFSLFRPSGAQLTTVEMQPLISRIYGNPFAVAWGNFPGFISPDFSTPGLSFGNVISFMSSPFFLSCISILILVYFIIRQGKAETGLLVVWSLVIVLAALGQRRFGYYLAVNVALLNGYLILFTFNPFNIKQLLTKVKDGLVTRHRQKRKESSVLASLAIGLTTIVVYSYTFVLFIISVLKFTSLGTLVGFAVFSIYVIWYVFNRSKLLQPIVVILVFFMVIAPIIFFPSPNNNKSPAVLVASSTPYAPTDAWITSLEWLKNNSPEPMGSSDAYYQIYEIAPAGQSFQFPDSAYGILAWWDYGYWITRIAHRIPNANPSQDPLAITTVASFFTSQDEESASEIRQTLDSTYIVIDHETALSKFWAIATWAGKPSSAFLDTYLVPQQDGTFRPYVLYYPEYYRSQAIRLFNFEGKAVSPENVLVIKFSENKDRAGNTYKVITDARQFATYEEAREFLAEQQTNNYRIVSGDPMKSPVPLEAVERYRLIHSSEEAITLQNGVSLPSLKIFEFVE